MAIEASELLRKAIDLHCHCYPDISLDCNKSTDDVAALQLARDAGMRGIVFKAQIWPTIGKVYELRRLVPEMGIWSSITLNASVGGVKPWVIEAAAKQGAKVVWMPTWSPIHKVKEGWEATPAYFKKYLPALQQYYETEEGTRITDSAGRLTDDVVQVVRMIKDFDLALSTGHLSHEESLALAEECHRTGIRKLIWGHPFSRGAPPPDTVKAMVNFGAYVEFCALSTITVSPKVPRLHPTDIAKAIQQIGYKSCVLTSDSFPEWAPPPSELLRMLVVMLLDLGVDAQGIKVMIQDNPASILGLKTIEEQTLKSGDQ